MPKSAPPFETACPCCGATLKIDPQTKTVISHIEDGFDFLGQNVGKYRWKEFGGRTKLQIKPAKKNVKAFLDKIMKVI